MRLRRPAPRIPLAAARCESPSRSSWVRESSCRRRACRGTARASSIAGGEPPRPPSSRYAQPDHPSRACPVEETARLARGVPRVAQAESRCREKSIGPCDCESDDHESRTQASRYALSLSKACDKNPTTMPSQPMQRVVRASNLNFTVLEMGESKSPLVLCLHGFPDTAHSFRHQMPALAAAGYHCVAPFMRGYVPTEPAPDGRYDSAALSEDALALITALGYEDAIVFGHDWGAVAAYGAAAASPDRVSKLVTAAVGYGSGFFEALVTNYAQQRRSWYMFFFQTKIAEAAVSLNDFAFLEKLWADWSPGWKWTHDDMEALKR